MRVSLSYSVDLEDVPEHVSQLIDDEWERISFCDHIIHEIIDSLKSEDIATELAIKKIDKIRRILGSIDTRLKESENILKGYKSAIEQSETQQAISESPIQDYNTPYEVPKESEK
jgi:hypothetical protein